MENEIIIAVVKEYNRQLKINAMVAEKLGNISHDEAVVLTRFLSESYDQFIKELSEDI